MEQRQKLLKKYFNRKWYVSQHPESASYPGGPMNHYFETGWKLGYDPSPLFSTEKYLDAYPDIREAGICPLLHYANNGYSEMRHVFSVSGAYHGEYDREPYRSVKKKYFDAGWYTSHYKDAADYADGAFSHYVNVGWKLGYDPSPLFSTERYLKEYPDVRRMNICPLVQFIETGYMEEDHRAFSLNPVYDGDYRPHPFMFIPRLLGRIRFAGQIRQARARKIKIAVIFHMYFVKSFTEARYYLDNLRCYDYDLFVTYDGAHPDGDVLKSISDYKPGARLIPVKNKGFDLWPFFKVLQETDLSGYDVIFKLQSKGTYRRAEYINGHFFKDRDWFTHLFDGVLGPINVHRTVGMLTSPGRTGLVASEKLLFKDPVHKKYFTRLQLQRFGIDTADIPEDYTFVGGTCFAMRPEAAEALKSLPVTEDSFDDSERGYLSLAHAMERYICMAVEMQGYKVAGNVSGRLISLSRRAVEERLSALSGMRLTTETDYHFSYEFMLRTLEHALIDSYELKRMRIADLRVALDGLMHRIEELPPYRYLCDPETHREEYINYCREYRRTDYLEYNKHDFERMVAGDCCNRFMASVENLEKNKYGFGNDWIIIDGRDNTVFDGLHRASWLLYKYGMDAEADVLVLHFSDLRLNSARRFSGKLKSWRR